MKVKDLIAVAQKCDPEDAICIVQEEVLECDPDMWDEENYKPANKATKLYSEDLFSHEFYLLAIHKTMKSE